MSLFLDLIFPKFCLGCKKPGNYLCLNCLQKIPLVKLTLCPLCEKPSPYGLTHPACKTSLGLDGMVVLSDYRGITRTLIQKVKYKSVFDLSKTLADIFIQQYPSFFFTPDMVTFIPLYPSREKARGFNQSLLLAKLLAKNYGWAFVQILKRVKNNKPQMSINNYQLRRKNIKGAFAVQQAGLIKGKDVVIVDDVTTTGATILEATKVLKRNGVRTVWGMVLARKQPNSIVS